MELEWGDPPPKKASGPMGDKWATIADELRKRPGEWARVATGVHGTVASHINSGKMPGFVRGEFEATTRRPAPNDPRVDVWARYVGPVTP